MSSPNAIWTILTDGPSCVAEIAICIDVNHSFVVQKSLTKEEAVQIRDELTRWIEQLTELER